jgi:glycosyltransferase involved in cell wall biosynthesis
MNVQLDSNPAVARPFVSVVIPVYNDPDRLTTCLAALQAQTYPKSLYEVIVVDNGSDAPIDAIVSRFPFAAAAAREATPGSYAARNKGLSLAKGEVIAFTDSDCIPAPDWIERGVVKLSSVANCGLVGGRIDLVFRDPRCPRAVELYDAVMIGLPQRTFVEEKQYGATANVFTFRRVIDHVGPFDATLKSNGDNEWGKRVHRAGYTQVYGDDVRVSHPARDSLRGLLKKVIRVTGGYHDSRKRKGDYRVREWVRDVARDLGAFRVFMRTWSNEHLTGVRRRLQFATLVLVVKYARAFERVRLQLGGRSFRG